jgi:hypothetical protein
VFDHATSEEQDSAVFAQVTFEVVETGWDDQQRCNVEVFDGYSDVPIFVANGTIYIQAPLGYVLETVRTHVSQRKRYLEVRVSNEGRAALPLARVWRAIHGKRLA